MKQVELKKYLDQLKEKRRTRRVTQEYQLAGLAVAETLHDEKHKALYIKLAKQYGSDKLVALAKDVAERGNVKKKGAYFMKIVHETLHRKLKP